MKAETLKLKLIALAQHLELKLLDFSNHIGFNSEIYCGATLEDFNEFSGANYEDIEYIDENNEKFITWLEENTKLLTEELTVNPYDNNLIEYGDQEFLVVTDDEADQLWEERLDNYLEECIYPELPDNLVNYFDDEAWKRDARFDGRGYSLSSYDGIEYEETVYDTETFNIYRVN
jgi:hypothetical protein